MARKRKRKGITMKRFVLAMILALSNSACSGGGSSSTPSAASGNVVLSPMGTAANPANEAVVKGSFVLTASEAGYNGNFTAQTIVGSCWVVPPTSEPAGFLVGQGLLCIGGGSDIEQIKVTDSAGNSTITYIRSI